MARAIYYADNDLDGDCVGDMIYGDFRIDGSAEHAREQTLAVCRAAARAAIEAMAEAGCELIRQAMIDAELDRIVIVKDRRG